MIQQAALPADHILHHAHLLASATALRLVALVVLSVTGTRIAQSVEHLLQLRHPLLCVLHAALACRFASLFGPTKQEVRQFTSEPVIIAETSVETSTDEVSAVNSLVRGVIRHRGVLGLIWFNYDKAGVDWRVQSRPALQDAFDHDLARLPLVDPRK